MHTMTFTFRTMRMLSVMAFTFILTACVAPPKVATVEDMMGGDTPAPIKNPALPSLDVSGYEAFKDFFMANRGKANPENHMNTDLSQYALCEDVPAPDLQKLFEEHAAENKKSQSLMSQSRQQKMEFAAKYEVYDVYAPVGQCEDWEQQDYYLHAVQRTSTHNDYTGHMLIYSESWTKGKAQAQNRFTYFVSTTQSAQGDVVNRLFEKSHISEDDFKRIKDNMNPPLYAFGASMTYPNGFDDEVDMIHITDTQSIDGNFVTSYTRQIDAERKKIFAYKGDKQTGVTRMKHGKLHGLLESELMNLCYEEGEKVDKSSCDAF